MCGVLCTSFSHFVLPRKTLTTITYSRPVSQFTPSCETWQLKPPPHHSFTFLSLSWKLFFADRLQWFLSECWTQTRVASFSSNVCCIFWFINTFLIVAPPARQESQSGNLACALCELNQIQIWNIDECINLFIVEKPLCIQNSLISCSGTALELTWSLLASHMWPPNRAAWCTTGTMEWWRQGKWFGSNLRAWRSLFKATCWAKASTGLLSALDVDLVMSLWRVQAVLAGRLQLHCVDVWGPGPCTETWLGSTKLWCSVRVWLVGWSKKFWAPKNCVKGTVTRSHLDENTHTLTQYICHSRVCNAAVIACADYGLNVFYRWEGNNDQIAVVM